VSEGFDGRIRTRRRGVLQPLIPRAPLLSSSGRAPWRGIILEKHMADADYLATDVDVCSDLVHIFTGLPARHEWRADGRHVTAISAEGSVVVEPRGMHVSVHVVRAKADIQWILEFDASVISQRLEERLHGRALELAPRFDLRDPQVSRMVQALQADVDTGSPGGSLFGELIGDALALYLASPTAAQPKTGRMPGVRLNRVVEFIHANLERNIHLEELAQAAGMSAYHFAKLFKSSTGSSPHKYVLQCRLERAKQLLRDSLLSLSEVSLLCGFADQSHLTNVFRRFVGVAPSRYRAVAQEN
jgi:AraC family transcriptional regulator